MSLVRFAITNHPQQVGKRGPRDTVDERITPQWLFDEIDGQHGFTLDVAANEANRKTVLYFDRERDGLIQSWAGHVVWCNPPYSNIPAWVAKARAEVSAGCRRVVMLLPANRTEQRWWHEHIEPFRDKPESPVAVRFLARRLNFGVPGNEAGKFNSSPPFGLAVVTFAQVAA
jgi:phage N-6-adenine-methyltransferase